jgi:hypothetical protein
LRVFLLKLVAGGWLGHGQAPLVRMRPGWTPVSLARPGAAGQGGIAAGGSQGAAGRFRRRAVRFSLILVHEQAQAFPRVHHDSPGRACDALEGQRPEQDQGDVPRCRQDLGGVPSSDATCVLAQRDVADMM